MQCAKVLPAAQASTHKNNPPRDFVNKVGSVNKVGVLLLFGSRGRLNYPGAFDFALIFYQAVAA
jgi:hypothetical protein